MYFVEQRGQSQTNIYYDYGDNFVNMNNYEFLSFKDVHMRFRTESHSTITPTFNER